MRIALRACAGPGKSTAMCWMGWNFISCYADPDNHPKAAAMSVTGDNLKDNMWSEFAKWQERSEYLKRYFRHNAEQIVNIQHPKTWFISARAIPKKANPEEIGRVLSGLHAKYILYLIDEAGDIPPQVIKSAEQGLATKESVFKKIVMSGNPTSQTGMLYQACTKLREKFFVIRITGDPDDPKRSPRIDAEWARDQIKEYGRDDPWVMAYILGEFPPGGINVLLTVEEVEAAIGRHITKDKYEWSQKRLGVDVARFGLDKTVLFPRQGLAAFRPIEMRGAKTDEIGARVLVAHENWRHEADYVDGTGGFGAGVVDHLIAAGRTPFEVNASSKASSVKFYNKRAECWFRMSKWVKRGGCLPPIDGLIPQLTQPTYSLKNGKFLMEDKDQIKKRLGLSPDHADALSLTFADPDKPAIKTIEGRVITAGRPNMRPDYDPYDKRRLR